MTLSELFTQAAADSRTLPEKPDNTTLLRLYALYKQATEGDAGGDGPENMFDLVGKAKYDAWSALRGKDKESAMQEYVDLVQQLRG